MKHIVALLVLSVIFITTGCTRNKDQTETQLHNESATGKPVEVGVTGAKPKFAEIGVAEILIPGQDPPAKGWPVMLLLHADRSDRQAMRDFAPILVQSGFAAISISAPIPSPGGEGYIWPPLMGLKLAQQYIDSAVAPFVDSPELNLGQVILFGMREGGWNAILLQGVFPHQYAGTIALGPKTMVEKLPNAPAPENRPLGVVASSDDSRAVYIASHFERLWQKNEVPFKKSIIPIEENLRGQWLLATAEVADWIRKTVTYADGKFEEPTIEYPSGMPSGK